MVNFHHLGFFSFLSSSIQLIKVPCDATLKTDNMLKDAAKWYVLNLACLLVVCDVGRWVDAFSMVHVSQLENHFAVLILCFYLYVNSRV